ncbi:MAG: efflux RND transporter permease subunit [Clostridia bacterium]|nr:efflux RND transporter permease subunit [Clostridia bacterium]
MTRILKALICQRKITLFVVALLAIIGLMNYALLPKQQSPAIKLSTALITTVFPGGSASDVERLVTREIEEELMSLEAYDEVASYSSPNISVIFYTVKVADDYEKSWDEVRRAMSALQDSMPEGCQRITVDTDFMQTAGFILSLHGENYDSQLLSDYGDRIKTALLMVDGINRIELEGDREQELVVTLDYQKMNTLRISYEQVIQMINSENFEIPLGNVTTGNEKMPLKVAKGYHAVEDIGETVIAISPESGIITRLKDISEIHIAEKNQIRALHNGENTLLFSGYFEEDTNIIPIGHALDEVLDAIVSTLPNDLYLEKVLFQPKTVEREVGNFMISLLQGIVLVVIVVFIGLGFRNALVVAVAIPLSVFITLSSMRLFNLEIHQISIVALIIALGMLVDNAIVVSDAIQVRIDHGEARFKACVDGVNEVARPVLTSTLTTICTFMPLLLLKGEMGDYLVSLPAVVIMALISSYLVAMFVTPVLAHIFFVESGKREAWKWDMTGVLDYALNHRGRILLGVTLLFFFSLSLVQIIGLKFFPYADTDMIYINAKTERLVDLDHTEDLAKEISRTVAGSDVVKQVVAMVGDGMPRFFDTMYPASPSEDYTQLLLTIDKSQIGSGRTYESLAALRDDLQRRLDENVIGSQIEVMLLEQGEPIGAPVNVKVSGDNTDQLKAAGDYVVSLLEEIPGTLNVASDFADKRLIYSMAIDRYKASQRGLSAYEIQSTLSMLVNGSHAGILYTDKADYDIKIESNAKQLSELKNVKIKSPITGEKYFIKELGELYLDDERPMIKKVDGRFVVNINAYVQSGYSAVEIQKSLANKMNTGQFPQLKFDFQGESDSINRNFGEIAITGLIFIAMIFLILLIQFKSFSKTLIILVTIPLSVIGALFGLALSGISLSFTAFLGIVSLAGIVVNNAIVLVDYIDEGTASGLCLRTACIEASKQRTRPIVLSTTTTAVGLVPLILMKNDLFTPMAVTLMAGLIMSTILTLVVIPTLMNWKRLENKYSPL